jgi:phosphatidylinositol glycan class F
LQSLQAATLSTLVGSVLFYLLSLSLGAPLRLFPLVTQLQTYTLALLLSVLVVYTPIAVLGPPLLLEGSRGVERWVWMRLFVEVEWVEELAFFLSNVCVRKMHTDRSLFPSTSVFSLKTPYEKAIVYPALFTLLGAWLGGLPIALDWDRPWQVSFLRFASLNLLARLGLW